MSNIDANTMLMSQTAGGQEIIYMPDNGLLSSFILLTFSHVLQLEVQVDVHGLDSSIAGYGVS